MERIKLLIADDNIGFCDLLNKELEKEKDIQVVGIANTDEEEIRIIDELKPDIVVTDLMRNRKYSGLEIIREYSKKKNSPYFLVISADEKRYVIDENENLKICAYIQKKPFEFQFDKITEEIKKTKNQINVENNFDNWQKEYYEKEIIELTKELNKKDIKILRRLGIKVQNKKYTEHEFEDILIRLGAYYRDENMTQNDLKYVKPLNKTKVTEEEYIYISEKMDYINNKYNILK